MKRVVLAYGAIVFGILASPLSAQQQPPPTPQPDAQSAPAPEAYQLPPPPPFPPMPSKRPSHRWVDVGDHHAKRTHHSAKAAHHQSEHRHHKAKRSTAKRGPTKAAKVHLSRKTIRQCHAMSYRQIMRHGYCRSLMKQEIAEAETRHASKARKAKTRRHKVGSAKHRRR